jgi:phenylpyruvate tautomerase PptA (4-oxalocrotonate tautomerase family)
MPHLRIRGMASTQVQALSENLEAELAVIIGTSIDNFTIELEPSLYFQNGNPLDGYPFIEIHWFARTAEVKQKVAAHITERVKRITIGDVAVVFKSLEKSDYFENGTHF